MKNRLKDIPFEELGSNVALVTKYKTRLDGAEAHLKNYDKEQEQKKADALKIKASGGKVLAKGIVEDILKPKV